MFAAWAKEDLSRRGFSVRTLAGAWPAAEADATVPVVSLFEGRWPVPRGGLRTFWREIGRADVVLANAHHYPLPLLAVLVAFLRRRPVAFVLHGADDAMAGTARRLRLVRVWNRCVAAPLLRLTTSLSLSEAGHRYAREELGLETIQLAYPLPALPEPGAAPPGEQLRVVWAGRLVPEKGPVTAVAAVERLRRSRAAGLDVYGDGPLRGQLEEMAKTRAWLTVHGTRPWEEVIAAMAEAHVFLATSSVDNVYVSALEALAIGTPTVSASVGEVPAYYAGPMARFCVAGGVEALGEALCDLAEDWPCWRGEFIANGARLKEKHGDSGGRLATLLQGMGSAGIGRENDGR